LITGILNHFLQEATTSGADMVERMNLDSYRRKS
jgi:hypothetical protein